MLSAKRYLTFLSDRRTVIRMTDKHIKQKLRLTLLLLLVMGAQPMLIFQIFPKETAGWVAGFNFIALTLLVLYGLFTVKTSFRWSLSQGVVFLLLCLTILLGRALEWDLGFLHQVSSAFYMVWLGTFVVESYILLKNKTRADDPGL